MHITPEVLKSFFDVNWVALMFAVGLAWKYIPALDKWWNELIPYANVVLYVLTKMLGPTPAHAAVDGGAIATGVGTVVAGLTNNFWANLFYDKFAKPLIEKWFGRHPSDIRSDKEKGLTVNAKVAAAH